MIGENALQKLHRLARAFDIPHAVAERAEEAFRGIPTTWFNHPVPAKAPWPSDISDEHAPYEFSLAFQEEETNLRFLVEPSFHEVMADDLPGMETPEHRRFMKEFGGNRDDRFLHWVACDIGKNGVLYKSYMNPLNGDGVEKFLPPGATIPRELTELRYVSRDALPPEKARFKVYAFCRLEDISVVASRGHHWDPATVKELVEEFAADRPIIATLAFVQGDSTPDVTLHFPMRTFEGSDEEIITRAQRVAAKYGTSRDLIGAFRRYSLCPLAESRGLISYVSWRLSGCKMRLTLYVSPLLFPGYYDRPPATYRQITSYLDSRGEDFAKTPFLAALTAKSLGVDELTKILRRMAFHAMTFQDIIRRVAEQCPIEEFRALARTHYEEDKGHHIWYVNDMVRLGVSTSVLELFGEDTAAIRDQSYEILNLLAKTKHRLAGVTATILLEEMGHRIFPRLVEVFKRLAAENPHLNHLEYFGEDHMAVENGHEIFEEECQTILAAIPLTNAEVDLLADLADRIYQAVVRITVLAMAP